MRTTTLTGLMLIMALCSHTIGDDLTSAQPVDLASVERVPHTVAVEVKLIEVSKSKMDKLGVDFASSDGQTIKKMNGAAALEQRWGTEDLGFVDALIKNGIGQVLANPRIATLDGKEASLSIGSQVERTIGDNTHFVQYGTKLQIEPKLLTSDKVQLDLKLEWLGESPEVNQKKNTNRLNYEVRTSIVTKLGESTLLARSLEVETGRQDAEEVIMLLVVTPEVVEVTAKAKQSNAK